MKIYFFKYQACGNDFIIIDNRFSLFSLSKENIYTLCNRKFGIGADGLIFINKSLDDTHDFIMEYYNSDGVLGSMCGNGGRAVCLCAIKLGLLRYTNKVSFIAYDGVHQAVINNNNISLKMMNVNNIQVVESHYVINTGSPHHVIFVNNINHLNINSMGRYINNTIYANTEKMNINFVKILNNDVIKVRTYERGVNSETLSCGTGAVASGIISFYSGKITSYNSIKIVTLGGNLFISFKKINNTYRDIWLSGEVKFVFEGFISI
jgi:diaminopimelate epimerase